MLRELAEEDEPSVQAWAADPEVVRYEVWGPNTDEETRGFLRIVAAAKRERPRTIFDLGFMLKESRLLIGYGRIQLVRPDRLEGEVGCALRRDAWGRGYATEAGKALVGFAAACLRLRRVSATCQVENAQSARVLEKVGMTCRARFRHEARWPGAWRESYVFDVSTEDIARLDFSGPCVPDTAGRRP